MPAIAPTDALIKAADKLVDAINDRLPKNKVTADAVEQLLDIFKLQAKKTTCDAHTQRVLREAAQAQRVATEQAAATPTQSSPHIASTTASQFKMIDSPHNPTHSPNRILIISQDDDSSPAHNTRHQ
jgi:hypothetical protein